MTIASRGDLAGMRAVGRLVGETLALLTVAARPGVSTGELDELGFRFLRRHGARSAPRLWYGFPGCTCISVNDEIVHGVPGPRRLQPGDVVKIDVTAELDGFVADAARTVVLPGAPSVAYRLASGVHHAFAAALGVARSGRSVRRLGRAVEREADRLGLSVVRELGGHGTGRRIHEPPAVANFDDPDGEAVLEEGLVLAVEPLLAERPARVVAGDDGWTLRTHNGALAAHWEETIVVYSDRPVVLTSVGA